MGATEKGSKIMTDADTDQVREGMPSSDPLIGDAVAALKAEIVKDFEAAMSFIDEQIENIRSTFEASISAVEERLSNLETASDPTALASPTVPQDADLSDRVTRLEGKLKHL